MTQDQRTAFVKVVDEVRANDAILSWDYSAQQERRAAVRAASEKRHKIAPLRAAVAEAEKRLDQAKTRYRAMDELVDRDLKAADEARNRAQAATSQRYILARSEILSLDSAAEAHALVQRLLAAK